MCGSRSVGSDEGGKKESRHFSEQSCGREDPRREGGLWVRSDPAAKLLQEDRGWSKKNNRGKDWTASVGKKEGNSQEICELQ